MADIIDATEYLKQYHTAKMAPPPPSDATVTPPSVDLEQTVKDKEDAKETPLSKDEKAAKREEARQRRLHERAGKLDAASKERDDRETKERDAEAAAQKEKERKEKGERFKDKVDNVADTLSSKTSPLLDKISNAHIPPGGIGLLLVVLAILLMVIVQVNAQGDTRLKQFWYMLNGQAQIAGRVIPTGATPIVPTTGTPPPGTLPGTNIPIVPVPLAATNGASPYRTTYGL